MDNIDYEEIASGYGVSKVGAKDLFDAWRTVEDPSQGQVHPEERFAQFVASELATPKGTIKSSKLPVTINEPTEPLCKMSVFDLPGSDIKERTRVEFVPETHFTVDASLETAADDFGTAGSPLDEVEPSVSTKKIPEDLTDPVAFAGTKVDYGGEEAIFETAEDILDARDSVYDPLQASFEHPETHIESSLYTDNSAEFDFAPTQTEKIDTDALESWDALLDALDDVATTPKPTPGLDKTALSFSSEQAKKDQASLKNLLFKEANHISDELTSSKVILAVIPGEAAAAKTLQRIRCNPEQKKMFVLAHLLGQAGPQPNNQLFDRSYRALDQSEFSWPSTGARRLVRRGTSYLFGRVDDAWTNQYDKKIKPIYLVSDSDKVLG